MKANALLLLTLLWCAAATAPRAEELNVLRLGTLALRLPTTWQFESGPGQRAQGRGPNGEGIIANYRTLRPGAPPEVVTQHVSSARGIARDEMPRLAEKNGRVVRPVSERSFPNDRFVVSSASQGSRLLRDYYFLQYLLVSNRTFVYMTVEGYGNAAEAAASFDKTIDTQEWLE